MTTTTTAATDAARQAARDLCAALDKDAQKAVRAAMHAHPLLGPTFTLKESCSVEQVEAVHSIVKAETSFPDEPAASAAQLTAIRTLAGGLPPDLVDQALKVADHCTADPDRDGGMPAWWAVKAVDHLKAAQQVAIERRQRLLGDISAWDVDPSDDDLRHAICARLSKERTWSSSMLTADEAAEAGKVAKLVADGKLTLHYLEGDGNTTPILVNPAADTTTGELPTPAAPPADPPPAAGVDASEWKRLAERAGVSQAKLLNQARKLAAVHGLPAPGSFKSAGPMVGVLETWVAEQENTRAATPEPEATPAASAEAGEPVLVVVHLPGNRFEVRHINPDRLAALLGAA